MPRGIYIRTKEHREHYSQSRKGYKHTDETKQKMSISHKANPTNYWLGKYRSKETKEKMSYSLNGRIISKDHRRKLSQARKGKKFPEEWKRKISEHHKKFNIHPPRYKGSMHPNWKGGFDMAQYPHTFNSKLKNFIKKRDSYICQLCGDAKSNKKLHIHHIDYDKKNVTHKNLITLCINCHSRVTFKTRDYWEDYFKIRIYKKRIQAPSIFLPGKYNSRKTQ